MKLMKTSWQGIKLSTLLWFQFIFSISNQPHTKLISTGNINSIIYITIMYFPCYSGYTNFSETELYKHLFNKHSVPLHNFFSQDGYQFETFFVKCVSLWISVNEKWIGNHQSKAEGRRSRIRPINRYGWARPHVETGLTREAYRSVPWCFITWMFYSGKTRTTFSTANSILYYECLIDYKRHLSVCWALSQYNTDYITSGNSSVHN